ncbi:MAG: plasmid recombination protein [Lachnospiraceae bacterium]|nr:plasmid recombination protein [Lachnospiraceae bacterium]
MLKLSMHIGKRISIEHNTREYILNGKEWNTDGHIDINRSHLNMTLSNTGLNNLVEELLKDDLEAYNEKQRLKHPDRVLSLEKLQDKAKSVSKEVIFQVGNKEDQLSNEEYIQLFKDIYDIFVKKNPTLRVFGAYVHFDETTPHMHLDFVPIKNEKKGLLQRIGWDGALGELGYKRKKDEKGNSKYYESPFRVWQEELRTGYENTFRSKYGLKIEDHTNCSKKHTETQVYRAQQIEAEINEQENKKAVNQEYIISQKEQITENIDEIIELKRQIDFYRNESKKNALKAEEEAKRAKEVVEKNKAIINQQIKDFENLKKEKAELKTKKEKLENENYMLEKEINGLRTEINTLKKAIDRLKEFLNNIINTLKPININFNKDKESNHFIEILKNTNLPGTNKSLFEYLTRDIRQTACKSYKEIEEFKTEVENDFEY